MPVRLPDINLLPQYERQSERSSYLFIIFVLITILSFILIGVFYFITKNNLTAAEKEYEQLNEREEVLLTEIDQLDIGGGPTLADAVAFAEQQTIETSHLVSHLANLLPANSYLSTYEYDSSGASISAHFKELNIIANYTTNLTDSDFLLDTKVNDIQAVMEDESDVVNYYDTQYTLDVNKQKLKKETKEDE